MDIKIEEKKKKKKKKKKEKKEKKCCASCGKLTYGKSPNIIQESFHLCYDNRCVSNFICWHHDMQKPDLSLSVKGKIKKKYLFWLWENERERHYTEGHKIRRALARRIKNKIATEKRREERMREDYIPKKRRVKPKMIVKNIYITKEIDNALKEYNRKKGLSLSECVRMALSQFLGIPPKEKKEDE